MGTHKLEREKKSPFYFYRSKKKTFLIFMNQTLKIGIFGKNKNEIIGYHTAEQTCDGLAIVGDQIEVNLEISINGLKFEAKTNIALNIFQVLKTGISTGTVQLAKLNNTDVDSAYGSPAPSPAEPIKPIIEPKRKSAFNTRLGTTGKRKFVKNVHGEDVEVSWVDIVELAHSKCGPNSKLRTIYQWTEENVYAVINNQKCSIRNIKNWEASIRQNRRKTTNFVPTQKCYQPEEINEELEIVYSDVSSENSTEEYQTIEKSENYEDMELDEMLKSLQADVEQTAQFYEQERNANTEGLPNDIFESIFSFNSNTVQVC